MRQEDWAYVLAGEISEAERWDRLIQMMPEESDALLRLCEARARSDSPMVVNLAVQETMHILSHLRQRHVFELYAKSKGLIGG